jgi:hypothetical protein
METIFVLFKKVKLLNEEMHLQELLLCIYFQEKFKKH